MNKADSRRPILVWDIPVRLLHFIFAGSISLALLIGLGLDDDDPRFIYHAWFGLVAAGALVMRMGLGFFGSRHARFTGWNWNPSVWLRELKGGRGGERGSIFAGHNPAASWVMLGMLGLAGAVVGTGLSGGEDLHETAAYALLGLIVAHLAGLVFHSWWHREAVVLSMVHGRKFGATADALAGASPKRGILVALALIAWIVVLARGFDPAAGSVTLPGWSRPINLMESEGGGEDHDRRSADGERKRGEDDAD